ARIDRRGPLGVGAGAGRAHQHVLPDVAVAVVQRLVVAVGVHEGVLAVGHQDDDLLHVRRAVGATVGEGRVGRQRVPAPDQAHGDVGLAGGGHAVDGGLEVGPVGAQPHQGLQAAAGVGAVGTADAGDRAAAHGACAAGVLGAVLLQRLPVRAAGVVQIVVVVAV